MKEQNWEHVSQPGNLWLLFDQQQYQLRVDQEGPAGETRQQQNENRPLQDDADSQEVAAAERLRAVFHFVSLRVSTLWAVWT